MALSCAHLRDALDRPPSGELWPQHMVRADRYWSPPLHTKVRSPLALFAIAAGVVVPVLFAVLVVAG